MKQQCTKGWARIALVVVLTVLLQLVVAGAVMAEKKKVTFWLFGVPETMQGWVTSFQDRFNSENPDIELEVSLTTWGQVRNQVFVAIAAGAGPDISYFPSNIFPLVVGSGAAVPISDYFDRMPDKDDFLPDVIDSLRYNGELYGMPFMMWPVYDLYNLDVLDNAGLSVPTDWDSMVRTARKATRVAPDGTTEVFGYRTTRANSYAAYDFHLAMEQLGSALVRWDDRQISINNEQGSQALGYLSQLYQAGMPPGSGTYGEDNYQDIIAGKVAIHHPASTVIMQADIGSTRLQPNRIVGPVAGQSTIQHASGVLYMVRGTKNPDATWRVLESFVSSQNLTEMHEAGMEIRFPVRRSLFTKLKSLFPHPLAPQLMELVQPPITTLGAKHWFFTQFHRTSGAIFLEAMDGKTGVQTALEEAERLINATLEEKYAAVK